MTPQDRGTRPVWVLASGNRGKLAELRALASDWDVDWIGLDAVPEVSLPPEGDDYEANARAKARTAARASGRPALGDDSGLEVDALRGAPGPRSARYGGPGLDDAGRSAHLLRALDGVPAAGRGARFVCVVAWASPEGEEIVARGACAGRILASPRGAGGFGYDPVFAPEGQERSMAELAPEAKDAISHRGRALAALGTALRARGLVRRAAPATAEGG